MKEEQQEVSKEGDHPCVPGCKLTGGGPVCGGEPEGPPVTSQPLPGWLSRVSWPWALLFKTLQPLLYPGDPITMAAGVGGA